MKKSIVTTGLAVALVFLWVGAGASAGMVASGLKGDVVSPNPSQGPAARPFKLKAAGQIDLSTLSFEFSGVATHLGNYTASGTIDPSTLQLQGTLTAANGDSLNWVAQFQFGPLGEIEAALTITGGTGRFANASGVASGPVVLDPDFMFTFNLLGSIGY